MTGVKEEMKTEAFATFPWVRRATQNGCEQSETRPTARSAKQRMKKRQRATSRSAAFAVPQQAAERLVANDVVRLKAVDRLRQRQADVADGYIAEALTTAFHSRQGIADMPHCVAGSTLALGKSLAL